MRRRLFELAMGACLFFNISAAHAENWVRVVDNPGGNTTYVDVDVDSIHKDADGLVYFKRQDDWDSETVAFDCEKRAAYSVDYWKRLDQDWKPHPLEITGIAIDVVGTFHLGASWEAPPSGGNG